MKTAISIPDTLFDAAERLAKRLGVSRSELFQRAVRQYLREHRDKDVTRLLNNIYSPSGERAEVDTLLRDLQAAAIEPEEW